MLQLMSRKMLADYTKFFTSYRRCPLNCVCQFPAILGLIERYPEAELGSPGPLVHELEAIPGYESFLRDSVARKPTYLSIWMVNRILNSELSADERSVWLQVLRTVLIHPLASADLRQGANEFLEHRGQ